MIIPIDKVSADVLNSIIQEFVLREGTEYGNEDVTLATKIAQVKQQLTKGSALLVFSELHQNVNIMPADQFNQSEDI